MHSLRSPRIFSEDENKNGVGSLLLLASGIVGPVLFGVLVFLAGRMYPDYDHTKKVISELGGLGAPSALLQNVNFALFGFLTICFAIGLMRINVQLGVVPILVGVVGTLFLLTSVTLCSASCPAPGVRVDAGLNDYLHVLWAFPVFILWMITPALAAKHCIKNKALVPYGWFSLLISVLAITVFIGGYIIVVNRAPEEEFAGRWQRINVAIAMFWYEITSITLMRGRFSPSRLPSRGGPSDSCH